MIDRKCAYCDFYDPDFECTRPPYEPWACLLNNDDEKENTMKFSTETTQTLAKDHNDLMIGDVIRITLKNGEEVRAMVADCEENGAKRMCFVDLLKDERAMNEENTNRGGFAASDLHTWLNEELIELFPDDLREVMIADENGDMIRLPYETEVFGRPIYAKDSGRAQWPVMKDARNRVAVRGEFTDWYWLADVRDGSSTNFCFVSGYGLANSWGASNVFGVRPAFLIQ